MSRSRWKIPLCCRRCFETGEAILSHSHDGPVDIRTEFIAPGFRAIPSDLMPDRVDVLCERCNVSARMDFRVRRNPFAILAANIKGVFVKKLSRQPRPGARQAAAAKH